VRYTEARSLLETALRLPLPGIAAQQQLAPVPPRDWPVALDPSRIRHAAGLLLLFPFNGIAHIGQISLPGGVVEPGETLEAAALREAHEEIALSTALVRTLGRLTPVDIHVSGFRLHPIVGVADERPSLQPADGEVARVIEIPVSELLDPRALTWQTLRRDDRIYQVPTLVAQGAEIWGATAMVVAEFLSLLGWEGRRIR
jgi:8-oxo-dGTP pyrophosphatase MutT (NUDIX family)